METIKTGLTKNYVAYWGTYQAIKEAAQNIAYGCKKCGSAPKINWQDGRGCLEDEWQGFEKRFLYLGESNQRDDEEGLGNFGEGWKMFLLVMAREQKFHKVETVGYSFWGEFAPTEHGVEILEIKVTPNTRTVGTKVVMECEKEEFYKAIEAFAYLQGMDIKPDSVVPNRLGEIWVRGVRAEIGQNTNPANVFFAYSLQDMSLINRDRSHLDTNKAGQMIKDIIFDADAEFVEKYVKVAMEFEKTTTDDIPMDIRVGPDVKLWQKEDMEKWRNIISKLHGAKPEQLVVASDNDKINKAAVYQGYTIIKLPKYWRWNLSYLFNRADEAVKLDYEIKPVKITAAERKMLNRAKIHAENAFNLISVKDLPKIIVVEKIESANGVTQANGLYNKNKNHILLARHIFANQRYLTSTLIHEVCHAVTQADDNTAEFERGLQQAICNLLNI